jgi:hypothetical protein
MPGIDFYRTLTEVSFTLLGLWFTVLRLAHGGWRGRLRHRFTLHIALHFFLPGVIGLAAQLAEGADDGGLLWRSATVVGAAIGLAESLTLRRSDGAEPTPPGWRLRVLDPVIYLAMLVSAALPQGVAGFAPLQVAGAITGALFLVGLCMAWMAFAEAAPEPAAESDSGAGSGAEPEPVPAPGPGPADERTRRVELPRSPPGRTGCRFVGLCTANPAAAPAVRCLTCPAPRRP